MAVTILLRRGTKAQLDGVTLSAGELGFTTDTKQVFVGDGSNHFLVGRVIVDTFTNRPAAGVSGRLFHATDTDATYVDDGSTWVDVSGGISDLDDVADGTTYGRVRQTELDNGYVKQIRTSATGDIVTASGIKSHIDLGKNFNLFSICNNVICCHSFKLPKLDSKQHFGILVE